MMRWLLLGVVVALAVGAYIVLGGDVRRVPNTLVTPELTRDVVAAGEVLSAAFSEVREPDGIAPDPLVIPAEAVPLEDTLPPSFAITARITGSDGQPLDRARVEFTSTKGRQHEVLGVGLSRPDGSVTVRAESSALEPRRTTQSKEAFLVFADDHRVGGYEFELGERESLELGDISLSPGVRLAGRVTDSLGRPAAGIEVSVRPDPTFRVTSKTAYPFRPSVDKKPDNRASTYAMTDREGRWVAFVERGRWVAEVELSSRASASTRVEVGEGGLEEVEVVVAVDPIAGRVVDAAGRPVRGVSVRLTMGLEVVTAADGRFAFPYAAADCAQVFARHPDYLDWEAELDGERHDIEVVLEEGAPLDVTFTGNDGLPVEIEALPGTDVMLLMRRSDGEGLSDRSPFDARQLRRARSLAAGYLTNIDPRERAVRAFAVEGTTGTHRHLARGDYRVMVLRWSGDSGAVETIASVPFHVPDASPVALTVVIP